MKRLIILTLTALCMTMAVSAQSSLHIGRLFTQLQGDPDASVTCIRGGALKDYKLNLFYSVVVEDNDGLSGQIEAALAKDARKALDREVQYKGGRLHYAFYVLGKTAEGLNRYILFSGGRRTVLIYLEGRADRSVINSFLKK